MCVCVYLSVTALTATYIILKSKVRYHRGFHGVLSGLLGSQDVHDLALKLVFDHIRDVIEHYVHV